MKRKIKEEKFVFCPRCKSTNVSGDINILIIMGAPQGWKCNDCGYKAIIFPEAVREELNPENEKR